MTELDNAKVKKPRKTSISLTWIDDDQYDDTRHIIEWLRGGGVSCDALLAQLTYWAEWFSRP